MFHDHATKVRGAPQSQGLIAGLLAALFFGLSAPLISVFSRDGSPLMIAALLYGGATFGLLIVRGFVVHQQEESPIQRQDLPPLLGISILGGMVGPICLVQGLTLLPAGSASLLLNLEAVFTLLIAVLIGREHLSGKGLIAAVLILSGAVLLTDSSFDGATLQGTLLIGGACLAWGIDNNLSQRLSLRDPLQIALLKAIGASAPMLILALASGQSLPAAPAVLGLLAIGTVGYGLSIWLDLLALRHLGAAREAVVFATAPFVGVLFSVLALREAFTGAMAMASALMLLGVAVLLKEHHAHWHRHQAFRHAHRHKHDPVVGDLHHSHLHPEGSPSTGNAQQGYWHAHEHQHEPIEHYHPHVSDAHHRHRHQQGL
ncbi:EamA family transporter [Synechococcus sp. CS-602]|uniref:DMT family transporter n=1 Tax=unclassified Synechococcus TaxID=2626047 RepID=UPI0008FF2892|nr:MULTISPECIES: DMT family transporter [unclassified Synechococcus]APD49180.1 EamA family transporter [Synechococcus sp. SynAce01]MCT0202037.1 EamA family transporter [Synechococcus sp. CS-603]MCT0204165.1 EamA family transporter [Synechococcus sp. CS-602]MCT0245636.1 EamA family transporter [Synechococcus sp. CS-601]TWB87399.1 drug/metabolite transporter (DMT)-like permease [Synechococcus sp. Ace-Pa]